MRVRPTELGSGFAQLAARLVKGARVFVQREPTMREYDRLIKVSYGRKNFEHMIRLSCNARSNPLSRRQAHPHHRKTSAPCAALQNGSSLRNAGVGAVKGQAPFLQLLT